MAGKARTSARRVGWATFWAALMSVFGVAFATPATAVVDGQPDGQQHPNVGLVVAYDTQGNGLLACTGVLVNPTTVLTAAHCTGGEDGSTPIGRIRVDFDDHLRQDAQGTFVIDHSVDGTPDPDPAFTSFGKSESTFVAASAHDIGLIHLNERADAVFPGISPAPITGPGTNNRYARGNTKEAVLQVGYGVDRAGPPGQPGSQFNVFTRNQSAIVPKKLTSSLLFLGGNPNDSHGFGTPCAGDSGSPILRDGTIISLLTFTSSNCMNTVGGPRLDAGPARDFLRSRGLVP